MSLLVLYCTSTWPWSAAVQPCPWRLWSCLIWKGKAEPLWNDHTVNNWPAVVFLLTGSGKAGMVVRVFPLKMGSGGVWLVGVPVVNTEVAIVLYCWFLSVARVRLCMCGHPWHQFNPIYVFLPGMHLSDSHKIGPWGHGTWTQAVGPTGSSRLSFSRDLVYGTGCFRIDFLVSPTARKIIFPQGLPLHMESILCLEQREEASP